jgi:MoaA/NifB/PqqE/SkfB family radical SAM enzyme
MFKEAVEGITATRKNVPVTINTTIMTENITEIEDVVRLAKKLSVRKAVSVAHKYQSADASEPNTAQTAEIAQKLVEMKKNYPIVNSTNYFRVIAKQKNWKCKPWPLINVGINGKLVLPCYVRNQYETIDSVLDVT